MNKQELVDAIAKKSGSSKAAAAKGLEAFIEVVKATLKKGGEVRVTDFGSFVVTKRAATTGRNPRTGAKIKIAASKQPKFRAGKGFKKAVNK